MSIVLPKENYAYSNNFIVKIGNSWLAWLRTKQQRITVEWKKGVYNCSKNCLWASENNDRTEGLSKNIDAIYFWLGTSSMFTFKNPLGTKLQVLDPQSLTTQTTKCNQIKRPPINKFDQLLTSSVLKAS